MTITSARNALVTTLTSCGPYAANEISTCDFGVMESVSGCAIVISPKNIHIKPWIFGSPRGYHRTYAITGTIYIKDNGDPQRLLNLVWQSMDDIYNTISKDDALLTTGCAVQLNEAYITDVAFDKRFTVARNGVEFAPVEFVIEAQEYPA